VDDHADPVFELARLVRLRDVTQGTRGQGAALTLDEPLRAEVAILLDRVGHRPADGGVDAVAAALRQWAFAQDMDERLDADDLPADQVDLLVLDYLRYRAGAAPVFGSGLS
jgi:hypothetical protein